MSDIVKVHNNFDGFYGVGVLLASILPSLGIILVPHHNVILYPEYWYEIIFLTLGFFYLITMNNVLSSETVLNYSHDDRARIILSLCLVATLSTTIVTSLVHLVWSFGLGYNSPMPFVGYFILYFVTLILNAVFWNAFPLYERMQPNFRRRLKYFFLYLFWCIFFACQVQSFTIVLGLFSSTYQWTIAIFVPLTKELNERVLRKLVEKAQKPGDIAPKVVVKATTNTFLSYWLAVSMATTATQETCYLLLGINFAINIYLCFKTIHLDRKISPLDGSSEEIESIKEECLTELILNEIIEVIVPISFVCTSSIAYYGPNAMVLGIVGNDYWQYEKVTNFQNLILPVVKMAGIDSLSALIVGCLFWKYSRICLIQEYYRTIKTYWLLLAVKAANCIYGVSQTFANGSSKFYG